MVNVNDYSQYIEFDSKRKLLEELLIPHNTSLVDKYIENGYVSIYNEGLYVATQSLDRVAPNFGNNPYSLILIRQFLRSRGYIVDCDTNKKDICRMLRLDPISPKKDICDYLGIRYTKVCEGGQRQKRGIRLMNTRDATHTIVFDSICRTGREIGNHYESLSRYYINKNRPLLYFGENFILSSFEED